MKHKIKDQIYLHDGKLSCMSYEPKYKDGHMIDGEIKSIPVIPQDELDREYENVTDQAVIDSTYREVKLIEESRRRRKTSPKHLGNIYQPKGLRICPKCYARTKDPCPKYCSCGYELWEWSEGEGIVSKIVFWVLFMVLYGALVFWLAKFIFGNNGVYYAGGGGLLSFVLIRQARSYFINQKDRNENRKANWKLLSDEERSMLLENNESINHK